MKNLVSMLAASFALYGCEDPNKYIVVDFVSVSDCGHKFTQVIYKDKNGENESLSLFHGQTMSDIHGNVLAAQEFPEFLGEGVTPKPCTVEDTLVKKAKL